MKFTTLFTSFIACGSIAAAPTNGLPQNFDISKYVNAEQVYNQVQLISKIPKDIFVKEVNERINKVQKALVLGFDFEQKLEKLNPDQKKQLGEWWNGVSKKYHESFPTDPAQLSKVALPDLKQLVKIVYQKDADQVFNDFAKSLNN
jgi:hypothetical protein